MPVKELIFAPRIPYLFQTHILLAFEVGTELSLSLQILSNRQACGEAQTIPSGGIAQTPGDAQY